MKSTICFSIAALLLAATCGCEGNSQASGDSTGDPATGATAQTTGQPAPKAAQLPPADAGPDVVVSTFLDSLKRGDDAVAEALLTEQARAETEKANLTVEPPGTPSARYTVGAVQYVDENKAGAHVASIWEDVGAGGAAEQYDVTWVLRRQQDGWRIVGMATQPAPGMPDIFLNFENPQDMLDKVAQANAHLEGERTAQNPPDPMTATTPR
jgi:hypothetical protein